MATRRSVQVAGRRHPRRCHTTEHRQHRRAIRGDKRPRNRRAPLSSYPSWFRKWAKQHQFTQRSFRRWEKRHPFKPFTQQSFRKWLRKHRHLEHTRRRRKLRERHLRVHHPHRTCMPLPSTPTRSTMQARPMSPARAMRTSHSRPPVRTGRPRRSRARAGAGRGRR